MVTALFSRVFQVSQLRWFALVCIGALTLANMPIALAAFRTGPIPPEFLQAPLALESLEGVMMDITGAWLAPVVIRWEDDPECRVQSCPQIPAETRQALHVRLEVLNADGLVGDPTFQFPTEYFRAPDVMRVRNSTGIYERNRAVANELFRIDVVAPTTTDARTLVFVRQR